MSCGEPYVSYSFFFFFKQKTAYEVRISDWSSDVCSSDLEFLSKSKMAGRLPDHLARGLGQDFDPNRHQPKLASGGATCLQGRRQGAVVEVVELAPDRHAVGKARDLHAAAGPLATGPHATSQALGNVVGRGLPVDGDRKSKRLT